MNTGENSLSSRKSSLGAEENHSHFVDYQQGQCHSVDKPSLENIYAVLKNFTRSNQIKKVKEKSAIYLYDYAIISSPLYLVYKKKLYTMPKIYALCSFLYQSFKNAAIVASNHQVIHKICGRYFSTLAYLLPNTTVRQFRMNLIIFYSSVPLSPD